jgi:NAD-dependent SIR2 family protein deacetylase
MIKCFEPVRYDDLPSIKRCFVFGAGASYDAGVPVECYILDAAKWCASYLRNKSTSGYETRAISQIDELLTIATQVFGDNLNVPLDPLYQRLDKSGQTKLSQLAVFVLSRVRWREDRKSYFYRHDHNESEETFCYHRLANELRSTDVVITLNYDTFLETGVSSLWKLHYGAPITPWPDQRYPVSGEDELKTLRVLKLHGSAGWLSCPRCGCTEDFGFMNIDELGIDDTTFRRKDADAYCPECIRRIGLSSMGLESVIYHGLDSTYQMFGREHCMILPAADRSYDREPLREIWRHCEQALSQCAEVIAVGYSIPEVDKEFRECMSRAVKNRVDRPLISVVDPSPKTQSTWEQFTAALGLSTPECHQKTFTAWLSDCGVSSAEKGSSQ